MYGEISDLPKNKKEAEQRAAANALASIKGVSEPFNGESPLPESD